MSLFDATIDDRTVTVQGGEYTVPEALALVFGRMPDMSALRQAASEMVSPSPAMLLERTRWALVLDAMEDSGFDPQDILRVVMRASANAYADMQVYQPPDELLEAALREVDEEVVSMAVDDFAAMEDRNFGQKRKAGIAVVALGWHTDIPPECDELVEINMDSKLLREFLEGVSSDRRKSKLDELLMTEPFNRLNAFWRAELGIELMDLLDDDQMAKLRQIVDSIAADEPDDDEDRVAKVNAALDRGSFEEDDWLERDEDGLTKYASNALDYWVEKIATERMKDQLGPLAESRCDVAIRVDAPELATLGDWEGASEDRQEEIARAVEAAASEFALTFTGLEAYANGLRIAVFENEHTGMKLSLVPGGSYLRGFSEREEKLVREAGEADRDAGNWYETYEFIIEQADSMRPTQRVTVDPVLAFQVPSEPIEPAETTAMLEELPFRLMSEAEYEWVARGGRESELTWRGDAIPDESWMDEVFEGGSKLRNPFGMAFLGMAPEALADVFEVGYDGAPTDGTIRTGDGPRVARGGAEMLFPWQACGEWQLLTNSVRTSTSEWEFFLAIRPAIGVRLA